MTTPTHALDLTIDPIALTEALVDIPSPSFHEEEIADAIEAALRRIPNVEVLRYRNNVVARTQRGLGARVVLAGHMDTVPIADNVPSHRAPDAEGRDTLFGCGSVDMKSGLAVYLHAFAVCANDPRLQRDLTMVAYESEEVAAEYNGLGHLQKAHPEWIEGEVALLGEPSGAMIEAGCQGSIRLRIRAEGVRAHSARSWMGVNAMHRLAPIISRITAYEPRRVEIDGCEYREGLNIVHVESGVATNTIPDDAWMFVNFRFAPDRSLAEAMEHMLDVLGVEKEEGVSYEVDDESPAALPGLSRPAAAELVKATGGNFRAKYGWTDVARFSEMGIPAVNFGPGDPSYAHKKDEQCPVSMVSDVADTLLRWLRGE
ncbi:succinyl-diaminopimelate desuccinylase [Corynebacterium uropygiale]|uniref:Succinyl-diaminopimelate desuccinylase n=1 Tax=Corynebacterium uropygiale TaxID=1775911 RepID=A0A9X1QSA8_9CORY|nr:succinyl-diaminopimelate desuccinylase [Corynebacterium uropygiale]MCF4006893.1 succinyl-diaminopimelate desuccinylase [Corynebacterium uropygiale]